MGQRLAAVMLTLAQGESDSDEDFLHPEQKCGISAPIGVSGSRIHAAGTIGSLSLVDAEGAKGAVPAVAAVRLRRRKDKNRSSRGKEDQPANA